MERSQPAAAVAQPASVQGSSNCSMVRPSIHFKHAHREGNSAFIPGGIITKEHFFSVPLDWSKATEVAMNTSGSSSSSNNPPVKYIDIFVREISASQSKDGKAPLPYLLYLQGGPGFAAPRPSANSGWIKRALKDYRVLLLDQRGTGRSFPLTVQTLGQLSGKEQLEHFVHFRADSIVRDCEAIRSVLLPPGKKWTVLGQSFGGFCLLTYLSLYPEALDTALFTGGLPPVGRSANDVYNATFRRVVTRNLRYYARYPSDVSLVRDIVRVLHTNPVPLPSGGVLTARRFLQLGLCLGSGTGMEDLHYLLEEAFVEPGVLSYKFLRAVEGWQAFDTNPLYAVLHESIYVEHSSSAWAAHRVQSSPEFSALFDYQMVFPWMFEGDYCCLLPFREVAHMLAHYRDWPSLYNPEALRHCTVPCAAAIYYDDMYVERVFSEETARLIPTMKVWVTNEYQHSGIREDGFYILDRLLGMLRGEVNIPS